MPDISQKSLPSAQRWGSLRRRSIWLTVFFCAAFVGSIGLSIATSLSVQMVASRAGTDAAPQILEQLHGVSNAEKLIALGDQLVSADTRYYWQQAGTAMQALLYHPNLRNQFADRGLIDSTYAAVSDIIAWREQAAALAHVEDDIALIDSALKLRARAQQRWSEQRGLLVQAADAVAVAMVEQTTSSADEISRLAHNITMTSGLTAFVGITGSLVLVLFGRSHLLKPLLAVADYLSAQQRGMGTLVSLPPARSREMARVYEAAEAVSAAQEALREMAFTDRLTGLSNRYALEIRLDQAIANARRKGCRVALLMVDLDRFKSINDLLGHPVGDSVIALTAKRLVATVRESDVVARLGGDEFVVIVNDVEEARDAAAVAEKLLERIAEPALIDNHRLECAASIGICLYPDDAQDCTAMMKSADIAMYSAKSNHRGAYRFFDADLNQVVSERLALEAGLAQAIKDREFVLFYQPLIDGRSGRIDGVEALIRWQRPGHGLVSPDKFIPILEETGLIADAGVWVLGEACRTVKAWHDQGLDGLKLSVNISPRQFRHVGFCDDVARVLAETGFNPQRLELELTESLAMDDPEGVIATLHALKALGVSLAIDDFGTGYSSLAYLKLFPIDRLKIDRTFVRDLGVDDGNTAICVVTIDLAQRLKLEVVAEGVETPAQSQYLRDLGCQYLQGYLYSRPLPAEEIHAYLTNHDSVARASV